MRDRRRRELIRGRELVLQYARNEGVARLITRHPARQNVVVVAITSVDSSEEAERITVYEKHGQYILRDPQESVPPGFSRVDMAEATGDTADDDGEVIGGVETATATLSTTDDESVGMGDDETYECIRRKCNSGTFDSVDALRRHVKHNHPLECRVCGMAFGLEKRRRKHINEEHDL